MEPNQYMTTTEFAARIGIHPQTLRDWDRNGTLPAHHKTPGGRRYYTEEQAKQFLKENETAEKPAGTA